MPQAAQQLASNPAHSAWVSASAGTGKTKVLTDRILRLLLSGVSPRQILCLTFTKAAAAEMVLRLQQRLKKWASLKEVALQQELTDLMDQPPSDEMLLLARRLFALLLESKEPLAIQTIHSFCHRLLKRFPLEAGIAPGAEIMEEYQASAMLRQALTRFLDQESPAREAFHRISARFYEQGLYELLSALLAKQMHLEEGSLAVWRQNYAKLLEIDPNVDVDTLLSQGFSAVPGLEQSVEVLRQGGTTDQTRAEQIAAWFSVDEIEKPQQWPLYLKAFFTEKNEPRAKLITKKLAERFPQIEQLLYQEQQRLSVILEQLSRHEMAEISLALLQVSQAVFTHYQALKKAHNLLDYHDSISYARNLLSQHDLSEWVLYKLDGGIDHLLVDEAQDTSPAQWHIIELLSQEFFAGDSAKTGARSLFVVGDYKQSIFSFQGADPAMFQAMQHYFGEKSHHAAHPWQDVSLSHSFRSAEPVLELVDRIFTQKGIMEQTGIIEPAKHQIHRIEAPGLVELWPLKEAEENQQLDPWPIPTENHRVSSAESQLACDIASVIASWLEEKRILPAKGRPVEPGDILVLVRKRSDFLTHLVSELKQRHIPVAGLDRLVLQDHIAVMDLIALASWALLPQDDYSLACVLKSPLCGISEEALFYLCHGRGECSLWQRLAEDSTQKTHYDFLANVLEESKCRTPHAFFSYVLIAAGASQRFMQRLGVEVKEILDEFLSLLLVFEAKEPLSLQHFMHWFEHASFEVKRESNTLQNQLRLMTVHGAKGLQAPIVILPDTTSLPTEKLPLLWHEEAALPLWYSKLSYPNTILEKLKQTRKEQSYSEYLRLLYVALTRAEDELYITGACGSRGAEEKSWYRLIEAAMETPLIEKHVALTEVLPQDTAETMAPPPSYLTTKLKDQPIATITKTAELPSQAQQYGTLVHQLLYYLPQLPEDVRQEKAQYWAKGNAAAAAEALQVIAAYPTFFGQNSRGELPVKGIVNGQVITGQIDRVVIEEKDIYIIDFKTDRTITDPPPSAYIEQLNRYRELLSQIYTKHHIHTAVLWTKEARLVINLTSEVIM